MFKNPFRSLEKINLKIGCLWIYIQLKFKFDWIISSFIKMINPSPLPKKIIKNKDVTLLNEVSIIITVEMIGENKVVMRLLIKSSSDSHGVSGKKARRTPHKDVVIAPIFTETRIER